MEALIHPAANMMAAHFDLLGTCEVQEWAYHPDGLDLVLTITRAAAGPVWEVVGYVPRGQKVHRMFAVGNQPFGLHHFNDAYASLVPVAIAAMNACRPVGVRD